jgi:hypothetical protein
MPTTVEQLAHATGRSVDEVVEACRQSNILVWGASTPLGDAEAATVAARLGHGAYGAPPPPGQFPAPPPPPGAYGGPPPPPPPGAVPPGVYAPGPYGPGPYQPMPVRTTSSGVGRRILVGGLALLAVLAVRIGIREALTDDGPSGPTPAADDFEGAFDEGVTGGDSPELVTGAFDLDHGDCYVGLSDVDEVSCSEAHDGEVFAVTEHPAGSDDPFPGDMPLSTYADEQCYQRFPDFVGTSYEQSSLDFVYLFPTEDGWEEIDDRGIVCVLVTMDGSRLTGSSAGSGR